MSPIADAHASTSDFERASTETLSPTAEIVVMTKAAANALLGGNLGQGLCMSVSRSALAYVMK
jgi:hypothetical protein